jgi:integrase
MVVARKRDYLFRRSGSQNWRVRFQHDGKSIEKSLGTPDRAQAEILSLPLVAEHKRALLAARPRFDPTWIHELEPGRLHIVDGERVFALERELHYLDQEGRTVKTASNGGPAYRVIGQVPHAPRARARFESSIWDHDEEEFASPNARTRPTLAIKNADDLIFETYLRDRNITGTKEREARDTWALFKSLCNTSLEKATRDDGRKLVAHFEQQGLKSATIQKKIGWLTAAVNLAIDENRLRFNPFSSIVPKRKDKLRRLPLDADDIENVKRNLDRLSASDQLLVRVLATTGCRLSEAYQITSEAMEGDVRYVVIGQKTEQSLRRVPLPADVLPFLPARIEGPLFTGDPQLASKVLNKFLDDIGITDPALVAHSFRHRAADRLRAAGCPDGVRHELLGHETKTVAARYGRGSPVPLLREWIDKIGF